MNQSPTFLTWTTLAAILAGCSSRPATINPVNVDPRGASERAIATYDKDGDGALSDEELTAVPGIAKYKSLYDQDADGLVTQEEIADRVRLWEEHGLGFRQLIVLVTLDGRPLAGADVEFVPETYLGENVKPARGTTDAEGLTDLSVAKEDMPGELAHLSMAGVTGGTYKVRVTHPEKELPSGYQENSELGEEIALDTIRNRAVVVLKSP